ncbi:TlpA disulfide reductase family protein [uncultured Tenacibaculum sp.]|uniref:TlpA family protein disulfide reductase n=1 Tax=uncultured Tenacibaculum sp. TaxID=174713 RepID=UPI0026281741|nr:TlpA disulfide reductase family protein [uncultured Tenacibaculum sp.]
MKSKYYTLLIISLLFLNCKEEKQKDFLVLSGKVDNFKKRKIKLSGYKFDKNIRFRRKTKSFSDTIRDFTPGHYELHIDQRIINMYLSNYDDLNLMVDAKMRIKDPVFEGQNRTINNYLTKKIKKHSFILGSAERLFSLEESEFLSKMDRYKSALEELAEKSELPENYLQQEKRNINYEFVRNINNYQAFHRLLYGNDRFLVSENFPSHLISTIDFNKSDDYIYSSSYRKMIKEFLEKEANQRKSEERDFDLAYIETIHVEITDTLVKNDLLYNAAINIIPRVANLKEYYKKYMLFSSNEANKKEITALYNKLKLTAKGEDSPKFNNLENYEGGTKSLDDLIGNGKYKFIDIWATWCSICRKETPILKRLEQEYHGKNIEFISISVDKLENKEAWKKAIKEDEMSGLHLFAGATKEDFNFTKDYLIKGLPRFILIDPDGKIVTSNAPRPSSYKELIKLFNEENIQ